MISSDVSFAELRQEREVMIVGFRNTGFVSVAMSTLGSLR